MTAIIARSTKHGGLAYLAQKAPQPEWTTESSRADVFPSVRDATRAALFLPAQLRAFALPVGMAA
jgi:hypothetical protein